MRHFVRFIVIVSFLTALAAHAQERILGDGNDFLRRCTPVLNLYDSDIPIKAADQGDAYFCIGYIQGVQSAYFAAFAIMSKDSEIRDKYFPCYPQGPISNLQALRIVIQWGRDHPQALQINSELMALLALRDAFQCNVVNKP